MFKKVAIALMTAMMAVSTLTLPAMAAAPTQVVAMNTNCYVGGWTLDGYGGQVKMEVFDDGTAYYVYMPEANIGYYYNRFIAEDGSLCVYNGNEMEGAYGILNANQLLDYDGDTWTRYR